MADSFVLEVYRTIQGSSRPIVRLDNEAYMRLNEAKTATGLPVTQIASEAIKYALDRMEIKIINR
ncbi:MAG: hypothetical protein HFI90_06935 [Clostridia bacterium]|nr:hypothetical protein [Clostridia bacterium]